MQILQLVLQIIVALVLLNVWLLRTQQSTPYRGGGAGSMKAEFAFYDLPPWAMYVVGILKVGVAVCLIAGVWLHRLVFPAAVLLCLLMLGAIAMHVKVRDPLKRALPALGMLALSIAIGLLSMQGQLRGI